MAMGVPFLMPLPPCVPFGACSLVGKMVVDVPPSSIANYANVIAVCTRGIDISKVGNPKP